MKKILLTGGSGLLALNWALYLRKNFEVYLGLHNKLISMSSVTTCLLDLENQSELERVLSQIRPSIIINTAGMTNVDECELHSDVAYKINSVIPGHLAKLAKNLGIYFIQISTDHLFDGLKSFTREQELIFPINVYGKSKGIV